MKAMPSRVALPGLEVGGRPGGGGGALATSARGSPSPMLRADPLPLQEV